MIERNEVEYGETFMVRNPHCGKIYITVNYRDGKIVEIFTRLGKAGGCAIAMLDTISRLVSWLCQLEIPAKDIILKLRGVRCPAGLSCIDSIAEIMQRVLDKLEKGEVQKNKEEKTTINLNIDLYREFEK